MNYSKEFYESLWIILVEECGASTGLNRETFLITATGEGFTEWRFQGNLGFGGKVYNLGCHPYFCVNCYPEDDTPERDASIKKANERINQLVEKYHMLDRLITSLTEATGVLRVALARWTELDDESREQYVVDTSWLLSAIRNHVVASKLTLAQLDRVKSAVAVLASEEFEPLSLAPLLLSM